MFIAHRINYLDNHLASDIFNKYDGIEFDIRDFCGELIIAHDPFIMGQLFSDFIRYCPIDKMYIINIKSEGIEDKILEYLNKYNMHNYFFLDCNMPTINKLSKRTTNIAGRLSEFEPFECIEKINNKIQWVWIDVFSYLPLTYDIYKKIKDYNLKICLVSPELQGQQNKIYEYIEYINNNNIIIDAVCSKEYNYPIWHSFFQSLYPM
jgi:hypothetical protein